MIQKSYLTDICECQAKIEYQRQEHITAKYRSYDLPHILHDVPTLS